MPEGEAIEHPWVTRSIENAQRKVEARNFDIRKQLLEYDDVANDQRKVIYQQRNELLESERHLRHHPRDARGHGQRHDQRSTCRRDSVEEQWDIAGLEKALAAELDAAGAGPAVAEGRRVASTRRSCAQRIIEAAHAHYDDEARAGRARGAASVRARRDAADPGHPLARAPGGARPPAPGHPPARLRAEESEAGVQARGLRAVLA